MKPLYPLTFTKADTYLPCQIVLLEESELPQILSFQEYLCSCVQDKDTFVPLSEKEWRFLLSHGFTFAVMPDSHPDRFAYLLGCLYPSDEENLGIDLGLPKEELPFVGHLEIAMADPDFRGYKMHSRICQLGVERFAQDGKTKYVCSTVSPRNTPSLKALQSAGLECMMEKEKYGGKLRCIMLKKIK